MKKIFVFCIMFTLLSINGCAVYDSKRGIFVSSTIQTVPISVNRNINELELILFSYPDESLSDKQTNTYMVSGHFLPISHTYVYDEVDRQYLRQTVINSLEASGIKVRAKSKNKLAIQFTQIGMASKGMDSILVLVANLKYQGPSNNGSSSSSRIEIKGDAKTTIAASKDQAVRKFIHKIGKLINGLS